MASDIFVNLEVNFTAVEKHKTVEFRQHPGTINATQIIAWTEFVTSFVCFAMDATDDEVVNAGDSGDTLDSLQKLLNMSLTY